MMYLALLFVSICLASATDNQAKPEKCCFPDNWQGNIAQVLYIPAAKQYRETDSEFAYMRSKRISGFRELDPSTGKPVSRGVVDYNSNVFYNITGSTCTKSARPAAFVEPFSCMPDDSEYLGDYYVGGEVDGWKASYWRARDISETLKSLEIGFSKNCIPVYEKVILDVGTELKITANFGNIASRITDPTIFEIPEGCEEATDEKPKPEKCCLPDNWQGNIAQVLYIPAAKQYRETDSEYAYMRNKRMSGFRELDPSTGKPLSRGVVDFNSNVFYNITGSTCIKSARPAAFMEPFPCMPDDAEYLGDYYVGGEVDGLKVSYWRARDISETLKSLEIGFSKDCIPVYEKLIMDVGTELKVTANFGNLASRITDPTIFEIPEGCEEAEIGSGFTYVHENSP